MTNKLTLNYFISIGLTKSEAKVYSLLFESEKGLSQSEIAITTNLSSGIISSTLKTGKKEGYIKTSLAKNDTKTYYHWTNKKKQTLISLYLNKMITDQEKILSGHDELQNESEESRHETSHVLKETILKNIEYTKRIKSLLEIEK